MMDQPVVTEDNSILYLIGDVELCLVGFASGES